MANLIYPSRFPIPGALDDNNPDQATGYVDYLMIQRYQAKKDSKNGTGFNDLTSAKEVAAQYDGMQKRADTIYLANPPNINVTYGAQYQATAMGVAGMAAANMLASGNDSSSVAQTLKGMAGDSMPEVTFKTVSDTVAQISQVLGADYAGDKNALLSLSQGKIFNPYEEMIFKSTGFRSHNFQFKMVARNENESTMIGRIIAYLKQGMLPNFSGGSDAATAAGGGSAASAAFGGSGSAGRYLTVPDKFVLEFYRLKADGTALTKLPHFKFQTCVLENMDVSYTPDGNYVAFKQVSDTPNKLFVPAVTINLQFKEVAYITSELAGSGY